MQDCAARHLHTHIRVRAAKARVKDWTLKSVLRMTAYHCPQRAQRRATHCAAGGVTNAFGCVTVLKLVHRYSLVCSNVTGALGWLDRHDSTIPCYGLHKRSAGFAKVHFLVGLLAMACIYRTVLWNTMTMPDKKINVP